MNTNTKRPEKTTPGIKELLSKRSGDVPWLCPKCNQILGIVTEDRSSIRIKYKDFFVFVEGGSVTTLCRKCGFPSSLTDTPSGTIPEELSKAAGYTVSTEQLQT